MAHTAYLPIIADRYGAVVRHIFVVGLDLTGIDMRAQVRLYGDVPGAPLIDLLTVANGNAQGLRLVEVTSDDAGLPTSHVELVINETTMEALPYAGEIGDVTTLAWDWQITIAGRKRRLAKGEFQISGDGVTGAEVAPTNRIAPYGLPQRPVADVWSSARMTFGEEQVTVQIDGADLVAPLAKKASDAAASAEADRTGAELAAATALAASRYFPSKAAGEAASAVDQLFSTDDGAGSLIYYRRIANGSVEIGRAVTPAALAAPTGPMLVGYKAYANAPARTVAAKINEMSVSVDDFGAIGDGTLHTVAEWIIPGTRARYGSLSALQDDYPHVSSTTDSIDWAAAVAAQNAVIAQNGGEVVFQRGKRYVWNRAVTMESGLTYKGSGASGINQVNTRSGAQIIVLGPAAFINSDDFRVEITFENLAIYSREGSSGGHIFDWSRSGVVAKIKFLGCTLNQGHADKAIINGVADGGVFSIWMDCCDCQYWTGNTISPLNFVSFTINSITIDRTWFTCTTAQASGVHAVYFESANPQGPAYNNIVRDCVFEITGGGAVKMLSCVQSGIENSKVYDLDVGNAANPQFVIGKSASGPPSSDCWLTGVESRVGTSSIPDCRIDLSVPGQSGFELRHCSFGYLDGGSPTPAPGVLIIGGNIGVFQNISYLRLGATAAGDIHFGTTDPSAKSFTIANGYTGNGPGFLSFSIDGAYAGSFSPSGTLQWGGTRGSPAFYVTSGGTVFSKGAIHPGTPAGSDQASAGVYAGSGAPSNVNGANGDFYFRSDGTASGKTLVYHKEGGAWVAAIP